MSESEQPPHESAHQLRDHLRLEVEGLLYVLDHPPGKAGQKVVASVRLLDGPDPPLRDRVDLYGFRPRRSFAQLVANQFGRQIGQVMGHLALLLDRIERADEKLEPSGVVLTQERQERAARLLEADDLLDQAAGAMHALGYVGEGRSKRLAYLVATSRLLPSPLSAILLATSGSGKSELLDVVSRLVPPESVEVLSRISPAALYYAGPDHLRHKLILVDEQAGTTAADYTIRTLQTKGLLRLAIPVRNRTEQFEARGPIALMSGTTSTALNPENLSRCLQLVLDQSPAQTLRVQEAQRQEAAGREPARVDLQTWQDAQRLLEPLPVVIPYAERLTFPSRTSADRRGNQKLLGLVAVHTLLCQRRRDRDSQGRLVALARDYRAIHDLLNAFVAQEVEDLSPRAAQLYRNLGEHGKSVSRREASGLWGTSYNTAKRSLAELEDQELVILSDPGPPRRYRILDRSVLGAGAELVPPDALTGSAAPLPDGGPGRARG